MYHICYLYILETRTIPWADEEEDDVLPEAKDIITKLLCTDPSRRLSLATGSQTAQFLQHSRVVQFTGADATVHSGIRMRRRHKLF